MSRLTELIKHYEFMVEDLARSYEITTRHMEMGEIKIHKEFCQRIDDTLEALKELQHYKDLEEQGRLIEQKHGRWELHGNDDDCGMSYFCSECGDSFDEEWFYVYGQFVGWKYCPNCGAKMDEVENERKTD